MKRTGWEHHELEVEMRDCNLADLISIYKREDKKYAELCLEYVKNLINFSEEGKANFEDSCKLQLEATERVAVRIAKMLTEETKK